MKRRRIRRYQKGRKNSGMKFVSFIVIMIIAVVLGYITARFLVAPVIGYDTEVLKFESLMSNLGWDDKKTNSEEQRDSKNETKEEGTEEETKADEGYALQFGVFSTKSAAENMVGSLSQLGIETLIIEKEDQYKVISEILKTKSDAIDKLKEIQDEKITDVFITKIE